MPSSSFLLFISFVYIFFAFHNKNVLSSVFIHFLLICLHLHKLRENSANIILFSLECIIECFTWIRMFFFSRSICSRPWLVFLTKTNKILPIGLGRQTQKKNAFLCNNFKEKSLFMEVFHLTFFSYDFEKRLLLCMFFLPV